MLCWTLYWSTNLILCKSYFLSQNHTSRGGGGGHWKESPKKNAMNELQDKLMSLRLREAQGQAELKEVKLKNLQLESQVRTTVSVLFIHFSFGYFSTSV